MYDLRKSLPAKIIAVILLVITAFGTALGILGNVALGQGYGTAESFYEDILCQEPLQQAMYSALWRTTEDNPSYYDHQLITRYQGFAARIYDGDPSDGMALGTWGNMPTPVGLRHSFTVEYEVGPALEAGIFERPATEATFSQTEETTAGEGSSALFTVYQPAGYYTVVGYLPEILPPGSDFYLAKLVYDLLSHLAGSSIVGLTLILLTVSVLLLVFLLCAAGHRKGCDHICPNWQDRIPLDLHLCLAVGIFCCFLGAGVMSVDGLSSLTSVLFSLAVFALCMLCCGLVMVAIFMTLATRCKLGKWWKNTLCWMILHRCWRLLKNLYQRLRSLIRMVPFTWRSILMVCCILLLQTILTLLAFESYNGGFFFLVMLAADGALIVAAAWFVRQLQLVKDTGKALAQGDLEAKADVKKMYFDVKEHAEHLNTIGLGMTRAVEQRIKSERLKTELITNVSHDIKTPLTSIVNYVDLLKKEDLPETAGEYVAVLDRQSRRLKKLTEDLVEASKASTGNIAVNLEPIVVNEIIHQAIGDYGDKLSAGGLEVIASTYEGNLFALADGRLLWRVLDNLLNNICKYAMPGTRVYVDLTANDKYVTLSVKNISRDPLNVSAGDLMERFVRGDASRHTEGSGLGLNIAKSLVELMGGTFRLDVDGDLFKATVTLKNAEMK